MNKGEYKIRFNRPTRFDKAPYNTIARLEESGETYIQISTDEDKSEWVDMGALLVRAFRKEIDDPEKRDEWIRKYRVHNDK